MFFAISAHNGVPIYEQIVRQVKFAVAGGLLAPGERVPSVREFVRELVINPNTVARAYRELQAEGILETVRGTGLEIAAGAGRLCADERLKLVRARLKEVFREARSKSARRQAIAGIGRTRIVGTRTRRERIMSEAVVQFEHITKRFGRAGRRSTMCRGKFRPARSSRCWAKTAPARQRPCASCWDCWSRRPGRSEYWGSTRRPTAWRSAAASVICPSSRRFTTG